MLGSIISKFDAKAKNHMEQQSLNPFSGNFSRSPSPRLSKDQYGKPLAGSKTEERGQRAKCHILREIQDLCNCIHDVGVYNKTNKHHRDSDDEEFSDDEIIVTFGEIFQIYTKINDKVVGLLIAAKKRGFVYFEKEILFQRRDDDVLIALIKPINEIRAIINKELASNASPTPFASREVSPAVDSDESSHQSTSKKKKIVKHKKHHDENEDGTSKHKVEAKKQHNEIKEVVCNGEAIAEQSEKSNETAQINPQNSSCENTTLSHDITENTANNQLIDDKKDSRIESEVPTNNTPVVTENEKLELSIPEEKEKTPVNVSEPAGITESLKIPTLEITTAPDNIEEIANEEIFDKPTTLGNSTEESAPTNDTSNLPEHQKVITNNVAGSDLCIESSGDKCNVTDSNKQEISNLPMTANTNTDNSIPEVSPCEVSHLSNTSSENNVAIEDNIDTKTITEVLSNLEISVNRDNNSPESDNSKDKVIDESNEMRVESKSPSIQSNEQENCQVQETVGSEVSETVDKQSSQGNNSSNELLNSSSPQSDRCITPDPCDEEVQQILQSHSSSHVSTYNHTETMHEEITETTYEESTVS